MADSAWAEVSCKISGGITAGVSGGGDETGGVAGLGDTAGGVTSDGIALNRSSKKEDEDRVDGGVMRELVVLREGLVCLCCA